MNTRYMWFALLICCCSPAWAQGPGSDPAFGNALILNGIDAYAWMPPNVGGSAEGTVEVWVKANSTLTGQIWGGGNGLPGVTGDWMRLGTHSSTTGLSMGLFAGISWRWAAGGVVSPGSWMHVAATWSASGITLYIDGQEIGTHPYAGGVHAYATELIGASAWGVSFSGAVDDLRLWNYARSPSEIQADMNEPLAPAVYESAASGLTAYYKFDSFEDLGGGSDGADDLRDYSVSENHADAEGDVSLSSGAVPVDNVSWSSLKGVYSY